MPVIVSAYYKIPSKLSHANYISYLERWFRSIKTSVVFFTTPDIQEEILSWKYNLSHIKFVHLPFEELSVWKKFGREFWIRQIDRDPEKYHTVELAAIWYEKKEFILKAMDILPENDIFIWCDAGCIRDNNSEICAANFGSRSILNLNTNKLYVQKINNIHPKNFYQYPDICIAGAIIAGNKKAWIEHSYLYDSVCNEYDLHQISCTSDQYITCTCIDRNPSLYECVSPNMPTTVDIWFFLLNIL
jgi:hypothetical protein